LEALADLPKTASKGLPLCSNFY